MVGRWYQRPGLKSAYSYADSGVGPNSGGAAVNVAVTGQAWANPGNILANDGSYAVCGQDAGNSLTGGSDGLDVTEFAYDITAPVTGVQVNLTGFASTATDVMVQLLLNGVPIGTPKPATLPSSAGTLILGGAGDLWGASPRVNDTTFGVRITAASAFSLASA
jgi:hypothetical protein